MTRRTEPEDPLMALARQWYEVVSSNELLLRRALEDVGLSESTSGLLWALDPQAPVASMRELARALGCDPSTVTLMADKLERAGLAVRSAHPSDGRARVLELTEQGRQLRSRLVERLVTTTALPTLTAQERGQLSALLTKLAAHP